jgi:hypothetical protein
MNFPLLQRFQAAIANAMAMGDADWHRFARCACLAEPDQEVRRMIVDKLRELRPERRTA